MLKISRSIESTTRPNEGGVWVCGSSKAKRDGNKLDRSKINNSEMIEGEIRDDEVKKKVQKLSKSKNLLKSKKTVGSDFFIPGARLAFIKLRQVFVKAPILYHFDLKCYIQIETDVLGYAIGGVLSQLTSDDLD